MATYEEVKDIPNHPEKYLIDVRNQKEIDSTGSIPGSICIPLSELEAALSGDPQKFKNKYGRSMPPKHAIIIFSCLMGKRAADATQVAKRLGFINAKTYKGYSDWSKNSKK